MLFGTEMCTREHPGSHMVTISYTYNIEALNFFYLHLKIEYRVSKFGEQEKEVSC